MSIVTIWRSPNGVYLMSSQSQSPRGHVWLTSTTSQLPSLASSNATSLPQNLTQTDGTQRPIRPRIPKVKKHPIHHRTFRSGSVLYPMNRIDRSSSGRRIVCREATAVFGKSFGSNSPPRPESPKIPSPELGTSGNDGEPGRDWGGREVSSASEDV